MKLSFEKTLVLGFGLAVASLLALGSLQYLAEQRLTDNNLLVSHSQDVLRELATTRNRLNRADATAQSFVLTGDSSYLQPHDQATADSRAQIQTLAKLTSDDAGQQKRLNDLESTVNNTLNALDEEMNLRKAGKLSAENLLPLETSLRTTRNDAFNLISSMEMAEAQLLNQRNAAAEASHRRSASYIVLGSGVTMMFLGIFGVALLVGTKGRTRSELKFRALLESAPDAMVIVNQAGRIVLTNAQTEKMFGYAREELLGQPVEMLMPERYRGQHHGHRQGFLQAPRARQMGPTLDLQALRKDGTEFPVEISLSPLEAQGETLVSSAVRDVSEQKKRELALRRLSGRLLHTQEEERRRIAREFHDSLGQYMAILKMGLDSLRSHPKLAGDGVEMKLAECARTVDQATAEVRTVSHLLYPPLLEELGLKSAILEYMDGFAKRSGIQTAIELPAHLGRLPSEAELAIFRVLQESLTNVHRHSGSRTTQVRVIANNGVVILEVKDQGRGMPSQSLEGFHQDLPGMLGVGLRGMKERMRQLGGNLDVISGEDGTLIRASVPCAKPETSATASA